MTDGVALVIEVGGVLLFIQWLTWMNNLSGPERRIGLQDKQPLVGLKKFGFSAVPSVYGKAENGLTRKQIVGYAGQIDGYAIEVSFEYQTGWLTFPHFVIRAFFNSSGSSQQLTLVQIQEVASKSQLFGHTEGFELTGVYAEKRMIVGKFWLTTSQHIIANARRLTKELQKLGLPSVAREA